MAKLEYEVAWFVWGPGEIMRGNTGRYYASFEEAEKQAKEVKKMTLEELGPSGWEVLIVCRRKNVLRRGGGNG